MHYANYEAEDFASDPAFRQWVRQPDAEQDVFWKEWLEHHPEKAETLAQARRLVNFLHFSSRGYTSWWRVAAAVSLLMLAGSAVWFSFFASSELSYQTSYSEQREILLPDSTRVTLNANSQLRMSRAWQGEQAREVWLEGEAYFKVVKKPESADGRFIVHTPELDIEVLGTVFNVQVRRGKTEVVLDEGKVQLKQVGENESLLMLPGEKASLDAGKRLTKASVNPERYVSWKDNRLFFDNASLREIFLRIQDIHGYQIKVSDPKLLQQQFTGSCPVDDISLLITALSETFDLNVERDGKQITFRPKS